MVGLNEVGTSITRGVKVALGAKLALGASDGVIDGDKMALGAKVTPVIREGVKVIAEAAEAAEAAGLINPLDAADYGNHAGGCRASLRFEPRTRYDRQGADE